jgi:hypothetical protein
VVGVGGAELEVEAALDVGEGVAGADERQEDVVHRRVVPPARIRGHDLFGWKGSDLFVRPPLALCGFELGMEVTEREKKVSPIAAQFCVYKEREKKGFTQQRGRTTTRHARRMLQLQ